MRDKRVLIFDMDGVVVDSESIYRRAFYNQLKELKIDINSFEYDTIMGMSDIEIWKYVKDKFHLEQDVAKLVIDWKESKFSSLKLGDIALINGIISAIEWSKSQGFQIALATSSDRAIADYVLDKFNVRELFDYTVAGNEIKFGKPNPEIFLKVSSYLRAVESDCIVIEDSKNGVAAAINAGMKCIGYKSRNSLNQDLSKANFVIRDFESSFRDIIKGLYYPINNERS